MAKRGSQRTGHQATSNTYRFFVHPDALQGRDLRIHERTLVHQIGNVLRLHPGDEVTILDNSGWEHVVRLTAVERDAIAGTVEARQLAPGEPRLKIALYVAVLRGERFEWVLQKGTELGVSAFVPVVCERSFVDDAAEIGAGKLERWERIVREAAEQSRRGRLPKLQPAQLFAPACEHAVRRARTLLLWEGSGGAGLRPTLRSRDVQPVSTAPLSLAVFSGPEGGWTESEVATAIMYNMSLVSLGSRILRAETAPIAAATAILYENGDLE